MSKEVWIKEETRNKFIVTEAIARHQRKLGDKGPDKPDGKIQTIKENTEHAETHTKVTAAIMTTLFLNAKENYKWKSKGHAVPEERNI